MTQFKVTGIVWDTDGEVVDLPTTAVVECDDVEDVADALSDEYGWCVSGMADVEQILTARVIKKWAHRDESKVVHEDIPLSEAKEICSDPYSSGEDEYGPWMYVWYHN